MYNSPMFKLQTQNRQTYTKEKPTYFEEKFRDTYESSTPHETRSCVQIPQKRSSSTIKEEAHTMRHQGPN